VQEKEMFSSVGSSYSARPILFQADRMPPTPPESYTPFIFRHSQGGTPQVDSNPFQKKPSQVANAGTPRNSSTSNTNHAADLKKRLESLVKQQKK
jgi:hypothetical protein